MMLSAVSTPAARGWWLPCAAALLLSACATAFAPAYDPALVAGFNQANEKALVLFSAVSAGSGAGAFDVYAGQYDGAIGAFGALKLQAEARPVPELPAALAGRVCANDEADGCTNDPTPANLEGIIANLGLLGARHAAAGVSSGYVALRKTDHEIYAANVLAVEEYLKRE
jgi:hypothetical protein